MIRFVLDEHYPARLARALTDRGVDARAVVASDSLRGRDDTSVLGAATADNRTVVTEDVTTFSRAIAATPMHCGVLFCHHGRFPRTAAGLLRLEEALVAFAANPPTGIEGTPFVWWLDRR
ncbi:MAG TPA: DUF5615 family PIN-like protein [Candidatus Microbacterium stercoravium]|uniref:DUF5615 family PIN-like protein n=1 Tax=Candidatus Microbacterium stercoravium TaxID=2838697 RepID=A0A9D2H4K8_9MICO|nr:DUF5615 family PIN-like protein [Candidatus Microbacterium stercoravium]